MKKGLQIIQALWHDPEEQTIEINPEILMEGEHQHADGQHKKCRYSMKQIIAMHNWFNDWKDKTDKELQAIQDYFDYYEMSRH